MPTPTWPSGAQDLWEFPEGSGTTSAATIGGDTVTLNDVASWVSESLINGASLQRSSGASNYAYWNNTGNGNRFGIGTVLSGAAIFKLRPGDDEVTFISSAYASSSTANDNVGWLFGVRSGHPLIRWQTHRSGGFSGFSESRGLVGSNLDVPTDEWVLVCFSANAGGGGFITLYSACAGKQSEAVPHAFDCSDFFGPNTGHVIHTARNWNGSSVENSYSDLNSKIDAVGLWPSYVADEDWDTLADSLGLLVTSTYDATPNVTEIARTRTITFDVDTTDVDDETDLYYTLDGTVTTDDVVGGSLSGTFEINSDTGQFEIEIEADATIGRTIIAEIRTASIAGTVVDTAETVTIVADDYSIIPDDTEYNEGETASWTVTTAGIPDGTEIAYARNSSESTAEGADVGLTSTTYYALEINNNTATIELEIVEDLSTEGSETLVLDLYDQVGLGRTKVAESDSITILDTSTSAGYEFSIDLTGTTIIEGQHWLNEGDVFQYELVSDPEYPGDNFPDLVGTTTFVEDFETVFQSGNLYSIRVVADSETESTESFVIKWFVGALEESGGELVATSPTIYISDTSQAAPTYESTPSATSVNEGSSLTVTADCTTVPLSTTLYYTINPGSPASVESGDFVGGLNGSFVVDTGDIFNSSGSFVIQLVSDSTTEGAETFTVEIRTGSIAGPIVATTEEITVTDTSLTPPTYAVTANKSSVGEGASVDFNIVTNWFTTGTLYWTATGTINSSDVVGGALSGSVSVTETIYPEKTGAVTIALAVDETTEGNEELSFQLRTGSTGGPIVATAGPVIVLDEAYTVIPNSTLVEETQTVIFTVTALNANPSETLYWIVAPGSSIDSSDIVGGVMSGSVSLSGGVATFNMVIADDAVADGLDYFYIELRRGSTGGALIAVSPAVIVTETGPDYDEFDTTIGGVRILLVEMQHSGGWVYFANYPYVSFPGDTNPNRPYDDILLDAVNIESRIDSTVVVGEISVANDGEYDGWVSYDWAGYETKFFEGRPDWSLDDFRQIAVSTNGGMDGAVDGEMIFASYDSMAVFDVPLQNSFLSDGNPVPFSIGKPFNVPAVLIDQPNHRYQVHESGITSIVVRENGAVVSDTLTPGSGYTELDAAPVDGNIAADVVTPVTTIAGAVALVCTRVGEVADATSIAALPNYEIGLWYDSQTTCGDVLRQICKSVGAFPVRGSDGEIEAYVLSTPKVTADVELEYQAEIVDRGLRLLRTQEPYKSVTVNYNRNWSPVSRESLAGILDASPAFAETLTKQWSTVTATNSLSNNPLAGDLVVDTYLVSGTDASAEATRLAALYGVRREIWEVDCFMSFAAAKVGNTVKITYPGYGFESGRNGLILSVSRALAEGRVVLEVWI